jgi:hypothetical protein
VLKIFKVGFPALLLLCGAIAVRAEIFPIVCFESKAETYTRTLAANVPAAFSSGTLNATIPVGYYRMTINPGAANEESFNYFAILGNTSSGSTFSISTVGMSGAFSFAHAAGETLIITTDGSVVWGYNNTGAAVNIPRGVASRNYFAPAALVYAGQPGDFFTGINENTFSFRTFSNANLNWYLLDKTVKFNPAVTCGTITYQGRLSDGANQANGQYDLRFQAFDSDTGGTAQTGVFTVEDVPVTNDVFTTQLKFGSSFYNNQKARFLEIGVRPGASAAGDPYTTLTPRQPLTNVPFAVTAQFATTSETATNATNATTATTATNSTQLGGIPAASYLTGASALGQNVTTVRGDGAIQIVSAMTAFTLMPGMTQTINVPANSVMAITADGGIQSLGGTGTVLAADIALFVDGAQVSIRQVVINNSGIVSSVANWSLSLGQVPAAGSHTVEVKVRYFIGPNSSITTDPVLQPQMTVTVVRK